MTPTFSTYFYSQNIVRKSSHSPISQNELESSFAESLWKSYDALRREAALRLDVPEIDLGVNDIRVISMSLDGHKVSNAEGFLGRTLQITLMITLCKRESAEKLSGRCELGAVKAHMVADKNKSNFLIYAEPGVKETSLFSAFSGKVSHATDCPWGLEEAAAVSGKVFGSVDRAVNELIYSRLSKGSVSAKISSKLGKGLLSSFKVFINSVSSVLYGLPYGATAPAVAVNSSAVPAFLLDKTYLFDKKRAKITTMEISTGEAEEFLFKKESIYTDLNSMLRRRIKWLINNN